EKEEIRLLRVCIWEIVDLAFARIIVVPIYVCKLNYRRHTDRQSRHTPLAYGMSRNNK
ncbi:hypothetical protein BGX38DRAFT_1155580, partial [Terfezia claveryi]